MVREQIIASVHAPHERRNHSRVASYELRYLVTESPVPLEPCKARKTLPELEGARVPWFRDEPDTGEIGVCEDCAENGRIIKVDRAVLVPAVNRSQVEAKTVHVHFLRPVPHAVQNQPPDIAV